MNNSSRVSCIQRECNLVNYIQNSIEWHSPMLFEIVAERMAIQVFHYEVGERCAS
jgi:hypothetical protein